MDKPETPRVVVDTNVFVGAAFNRRSRAALVIDAVRSGRRLMPWSEATRTEIRGVLRKIPPISWADFEDLFREEDRYEGPVPDEGLSWVGDPEDRKFAALALATGAVLVSNDDHLLARRSEAGVDVLTSAEYAALLT